MSSQESDVDPYLLLEVKLESTEAEIRRAYRQRSLKIHPDRNPNNPDAARKFHELTQAYELLLDPLRRLALDARVRAQQARATRFAAHDAKRRGLQEELEARERAFKKRRTDGGAAARERAATDERIKDEGRRMREEREREVLRANKEADADADEEEDPPPALGSLDTTVRLKYALAARPELKTTDALAALLAPFGETDASAIVLALKPPKAAPHAPPKRATALVPFTQIGAAFAAVGASGRAERGLAGVEVTWAGGHEPPILAWLKARGKLGAPAAKDGLAGSKLTGSTVHPPGSSFAPSESFQPKLSAPNIPGLDFESLTLMRLRQAERERLEREIREQEAE